jgi:hypothetical protein
VEMENLVLAAVEMHGGAGVVAGTKEALEAATQAITSELETAVDYRVANRVRLGEGRYD